MYGTFLQERGAAEALMALQAVSPLPIDLMDATPLRACAAADVKAKHTLYYADSFAAALAIEHKATLVTADSDFRRLGRSFPVVCFEKPGEHVEGWWKSSGFVSGYRF